MSALRLPGRWQVFGLELDLRSTLACVVGTLLLTVDFYYRVLPAEGAAALLRAASIERLFLYLLVPLGILWLFRDSPREYGLALGDWRRGLALALGSSLVALPVLYLAARSPDMVAYYTRAERGALEVLLVAATDLLGWEFFFRGFLLFTFARLVGPTAILLQAVPFALAHLGKPAVETLTTIFGGAYFGWVAWRTRSFLYPYLLHWIVNSFVTLAAMGLFGG